MPITQAVQVASERAVPAVKPSPAVAQAVTVLAWQAVDESPSWSLLVVAVQLVQLVPAVVAAPLPAPTSTTLPAAQSPQIDVSAALLYLPAAQAVQAPSSAVVEPAQPEPVAHASVVWAAQAVAPAGAHVPEAH